eukprot:9405022-Heterocapsa_arctica.AAC.1
MAGNGARKEGKRASSILGILPRRRGSREEEEPGEGHSKRGDWGRALRPATNPALQGPFPRERRSGGGT